MLPILKSVFEKFYEKLKLESSSDPIVQQSNFHTVFKTFNTGDSYSFNIPATVTKFSYFIIGRRDADSRSMTTLWISAQTIENKTGKDYTISLNSDNKLNWKNLTGFWIDFTPPVYNS